MSNPQGERGCHLGARTAGEIPFHACFRLPLTLHGHKATDEAAETTSSPSPAHGTGGLRVTLCWLTEAPPRGPQPPAHEARPPENVAP